MRLETNITHVFGGKTEPLRRFDSFVLYNNMVLGTVEEVWQLFTVAFSCTVAQNAGQQRRFLLMTYTCLHLVFFRFDFTSFPSLVSSLSTQREPNHWAYYVAQIMKETLCIQYFLCWTLSSSQIQLQY